MNVVNTGTDLVGVSVLLEGVEQLHVTLGSLDGDDIGIETLDRREDIVKVRVTEVGVSLQSIGNTSSRELEGVNCPLEIAVPINATKRKLEYNW